MESHQFLRDEVCRNFLCWALEFSIKVQLFLLWRLRKAFDFIQLSVKSLEFVNSMCGGIISEQCFHHTW
uniref:Uncharacterized protein n=1 Tax=Anguilla anguilla TaxID=7936 RepID=A0A0E9WW84_ANGAN